MKEYFRLGLILLGLTQLNRFILHLPKGEG